MSTIDASSALTVQDYYSSTLSGTISSTDTVLTLASVPTGSEGFLVLELGTANQEIIYYNTKGASTVTCPSVARGRAQGGTTAVAHTTGASVKMVVNADLIKEIQNGNANTGMQTYFNESFSDYILSGGIWTADAAGSTRNASMTSGVIYINGQRITIAAVSAHSFTASKDTYVDVTLTTGNNTGTIVYTEVTNNAASPALASNSIRIATVVTGASNIAASTSIGQGGFANTVPTISSQVFKGFDSLGNIIYPKGPANPLLTTGPYKFNAYLTAGQNVGTGATLVQFNVKNFDTGNNFDVTTNKGRFTAPVAGFYQINTNILTTTAGSGTNVGLHIYKNGAVVSGPINVTGAAGFNPGASLSICIQLAASDYLEVYIATGAAAKALDVSNNGYNTFSGFLVSAS